MNKEEVKYPCENCGVSYCYKNCADFNRWLELAEEALNKQVDTEPIKEPTDDEGIYCQYICPTCGGFLTYGNPTPFEKPHHCKCGQKINWSN